MKKLLLLMCALFIAGPANAFNLSKSTMVIEGPIGQGILSQANRLISFSTTKDAPKIIDIVINSPGGSVFAGWQFITAMQIVRARGFKIRCMVTSMAASMAFQIFSQCDERFAYKFSLLLWHPPASRLQGRPTPQRARAFSRSLRQVEKELVKQLRSRFKLKKSKFMYHYLKETLHTAQAVRELTPSFLNTTTDVGGLNGLSNLRSNNKSRTKNNLIVGKFIYMNDDALLLWQAMNGSR